MATRLRIAHARVQANGWIPEELSNFVGCFLTGTAAEVTPVSKILEQSYKVCNFKDK